MKNKLTEAIGLIDEKHLNEYYEKREKRKRTRNKVKAASAVAACLVVVIGITAVIPQIAKRNEPHTLPETTLGVTEPTVMADSTVSTTDPTESTETPTEVTDTNPSNVEPGIGSGADIFFYIAPYDVNYYGCEARFAQLREDNEDYHNWHLDSYNHAMYLLKELGDREAYESYIISSDESVVNIENFVNLFDVTKEEFRTANLIIGEKYALYTDAQIEALFSGDRDLIDEQFINPCAIKVGGVIYTPEWIEEHTLDEIKAVGITKDMLADRYDDYVKNWGEESAHIIDLQNKIDGFDTTAE